MDYKVDDGIKEACRIVKQGYLAEMMGVKQTILTVAISHHDRNGKPYYFNEFQTDKMQAVINQAARELHQVLFSANPLSAQESPYSFGDTIVEQFKVFRRRFNVQYILRDSMGWSDGKIKMYLSKKGGNYYGKIKPDDIDRINEMVQWAARDLENITLRWESQWLTANG